MAKYVVVGVLVLGIALVSYMGCDGTKARLGVAGDKAIAQIDKLLGEIDVKQKKVENAYEELKTATSTVREKRIEAEIRVKNYNEKKGELVEKQDKLKSNLRKLKGYLNEADGAEMASVNDNEIPIEKLKTMAEGTIKELRLVNDQLIKNKTIADAWAKNLQVLKKQEDTSEAQLQKLDGQLDQIRSKKSALDAMKEAASIAGPGASISDKFNELTESVDELLINIDTKFEIEEAKLDERAAELSDPTADIDALLNDKTDVSDTLSEIDKLLGEGG